MDVIIIECPLLSTSCVGTFSFYDAAILFSISLQLSYEILTIVNTRIILNTFLTIKELGYTNFFIAKVVKRVLVRRKKVLNYHTP